MKHRTAWLVGLGALPSLAAILLISSIVLSYTAGRGPLPPASGALFILGTVAFFGSLGYIFAFDSAVRRWMAARDAEEEMVALP